MIIGIDATQSFTQYGKLSSNGSVCRRINHHDRVEELPILLSDLMASSDDPVREVITITGPGSYTGIRLSLTAAKMIAKVHDVPLRGVPLFDAYMRVISPLVQSLCIVTSNSRKGFLNVQLFQSNANAMLPISSLLQQTDAQFLAFLNKFEASIGWHHIGDACRFDVDVPNNVKFVAGEYSLQQVLGVANQQPDLWVNDSYVSLIYSAPAVS